MVLDASGPPEALQICDLPIPTPRSGEVLPSFGASDGPIGTAVSQQSLRGVLSFCNARQMTAPEAYIRYTPEIFTAAGEVTDDATAAFLSNFMSEFRTHLARVLTVIPRQ